MPSGGDRNSKAEPAIYVGVDPGLGITGYGVLEYNGGKIALKEAGCIRTTRNLPLEQRLIEIYSGLSEVIEEFHPDEVVIEDLYSHYRHPKTAIIMGHARGAVFLSAAKSKVPVKSYGATMIKKSLTGNGRASKIQVQHMIKNKLGLKEIPEPPDVADALAAAMCHINHLNNNLSAEKDN
ncbi:MAG: crossover junction endodeoxyribonuclease RuvC [candidate division Zixibacteria bacterium]|nr:crossover junction endodeoxyribonuclease RuvC [candidate division Zixibacteria bacterium]